MNPSLLCFRKIRVAKNFTDKRGGGGVSRFSVEFFCLTVPKNFVGNPSVLCFRNFPLAKKFMDKRAMGVSRFSVEIFCLTVPKKFVGEPYSVSLIRVSKSFMLQRVMSRFSVEIFLSHSAEKIRRGTLLAV